MHPKSTRPQPPESFYTVTGEIALARQRTAGGRASIRRRRSATKPILRCWLRATEVTAETLQPSLMAERSQRAGSPVDPKSLEAQRAAARAALALDQDR